MQINRLRTTSGGIHGELNPLHRSSNFAKRHWPFSHFLLKRTIARGICTGKPSHTKDKPPRITRSKLTLTYAVEAANLLWPELKSRESIEWGYIQLIPFLRAYHGLACLQDDIGKLKESREIFRFLFFSVWILEIIRGCALPFVLWFDQSWGVSGGRGSRRKTFEWKRKQWTLFSLGLCSHRFFKEQTWILPQRRLGKNFDRGITK